ncbi:MAG TPA: hypothetical protein VE464_15315 [Streptosporangiaceae bacterium]|jgi:hypothetical protein|nr:hypothetical protein [Streptosporangiaceae bacterium]
MSATDKIVAALEREWPKWQIWVVHHYIGGPVWCARRWDDENRVLNAGSADELAEYLEAEAAR